MKRCGRCNSEINGTSFFCGICRSFFSSLGMAERTADLVRINSSSPQADFERANAFRTGPNKQFKNRPLRRPAEERAYRNWRELALLGGQLIITIRSNDVALLQQLIAWPIPSPHPGGTGRTEFRCTISAEAAESGLGYSLFAGNHKIGEVRTRAAALTRLRSYMQWQINRRQPTYAT